MSNPNSSNRYRLSNVLGRGSFGEVCRALDRYLRRDVAVKVVHAKYQHTEKVVNRLAVEAQTLARLQHPSIIAIYDSGRLDDGRPYFSMPLIEGPTLESLAEAFHQRVSPLSFEDFQSDNFRQLLTHLAEAANAIAYAHRQGILHRDLKPSNILTNEQGQTYVVDWGTAKLAYASSGANDGSMSAAAAPACVTMEGELIGTPAYMSPELARGEAKTANPASDIYGLGAALYHLLVGRAPHQGEHLLEVLAHAQKSHIRGPVAKLEHAPSELINICVRALDADPASRFPKAEDFEEAIRNYLEASSLAQLSIPTADQTSTSRFPVLQLVSIGSVLLAVFFATLSVLLIQHTRKLDTEVKRLQGEGSPQATSTTLASDESDGGAKLSGKNQPDVGLKSKATLESMTRDQLQEEVQRLERLIDAQGSSSSSSSIAEQRSSQVSSNSTLTAHGSSQSNRD